MPRNKSIPFNPIKSSIVFSASSLVTSIPEALANDIYLLTSRSRRCCSFSNVSSGTSGYSVPVYDDMAVRSGNVFIDAPEFPEVAQGLDTLSFKLNIRLVRSFYYMELDGSTWYYSEFVGESFVPFSVENAENR